MALEAFHISINNPVNGNYHLGGETLAGNVKIRVSGVDSIRANEVVLQVLGVATTWWTELRTEYEICYNPICLSWKNSFVYSGYDKYYFSTSGNYNYNNTWQHYEHYHSHEVRVPRTSRCIFFQKDIKLWNGDNSGYLPCGESNFQFSCDLPDGIPSSFYSDIGDISYRVETSIVKPWWYWSRNETRTATFRVIHSIDLNAHPDLLEYKENTAEKEFSCLWCKSGPLTTVLGLRVSGAVGGDTLLPVVEVDNASDVDIKNVILSFVRKEKYLYHDLVLENDVTVLEIQLGSVGAHNSTLWNNTEMTIPEIGPRMFTKGVIISTKYYIKVVCVPSALHQKLSITLPVVVGTIPFHSLPNHTGLHNVGQ